MKDAAYCFSIILTANTCEMSLVKMFVFVNPGMLVLCLLIVVIIGVLNGIKFLWINP